MDDPLITKIEQEVLDTQHRNFDLLGLPEDLAITRLLKVAGDILRECSPSNASVGLTPQALHTFSATLLRALTHCVRWVSQDCMPGPPTRGRDSRQQDMHAAELLGWGMSYARLATDHVAWRHDLVDAHADPDTRTITFELNREMDLEFLLRESDADLAWWHHEGNDAFPLEAVSDLFRDWHRDVGWNRSGLQFPLDLIRRHPALSAIRRAVGETVFPELADDCRLGQYSLSDLRDFYAHVLGLCECIRILEDRVDTAQGQENQMGTWTLQSPRAEFLSYFQELTGLESEVLDPLLRDMTLNAQRFHCSITATPFVISRSDRMFLLPRLFAFLSPQRTVASALTSGTGRASYDRVSTRIEQHHLTVIGQVLRDYGFTVYREPLIRTPLGKKLCPDFIVRDGSTADLLVIDFKNALAATAVLEVTNRLKEYRKGATQVEGYLDAFAQYPELLASFGGAGRLPERVAGLLLFRVPMPLPIISSSRVSVENWFSLRRRLDNTRPTRVMDLLPTPNGSRNVLNVEYQPQEIEVGQWTYRRSLLFIPDT